jgi:hypothetical protein
MGKRVGTVKLVRWKFRREEEEEEEDGKRKG